MHQMLDSIYERANDIRNKKIDQKSMLTHRINDTETKLMLVTREMKMKINNMVEEVEQKVSKALNEEIYRLGVLVDEFNLPFHTDPLVLNVYKKEINQHVESGLGLNLRARLSSALAMNIESSQREMTERMHNLLPVENKLIIQKQSEIITRTQPFEMLYSLNCQNLCRDFQENLEFNFSWGITAMIQRFTGRIKTNKDKNNKLMLQRQNSVNQLLSPNSPLPPLPGGIHHNNSHQLMPPPSMGANITPEQLSVITKIAVASIGSQSTVGGLIVTGLLLKTIGWRVLVGVGALYSCIYLYERLSWTNSAKERAYKTQYVKHVTEKLRLIVDFTSSNCSHQVQQ